MSVLSPLYQLAQAPGGPWRVRVFNLPAHREGTPPALPFLRALAGQPWARDWQKDPEEKLTVLRLAGPDRAGLDALVALLRSHGISQAAAFAPAAQRAVPAASP